ncbi:embryonic protein UVS.2 isoform X1 [Xenopus tropicalis]|uniref:Metalloendopeptidase n=1 Tax=Xenopus tropicalis TaxID=8364 RepID=A0A6I8SM89_XENTR|nr:embryonic protein UVS.2 isoform X2 [Xenopus tropicalis]XP_031756322.1 embryonic protein UVS.2 isoform X1 [Xenopus tropicalis]
MSIYKRTELVHPQAKLRFPYTYRSKEPCPKIGRGGDKEETSKENKDEKSGETEPQGKVETISEKINSEKNEESLAPENEYVEKFSQCLNHIPKLRYSLGYDHQKRELCVSFLEGKSDPFGQGDVFSRILKANQGNGVPRVQEDIAVGVSRSAITSTECLWQKTNETVYVPYTLDSKYSNSEVNTMTSAMEVYATLTCVQFVPYTDEDDYVNITSGDGCWSYMGRQGGAQVVSVEKGYCTSEGTTMHELNHALGFVHEHSRSDRDNYVNIMYQYISPGDIVNFEIMNTNNLNTIYDYRSIMHYPAWAFSNTTGKNTIVAKLNPNIIIGAGSTMTSLDIIKINRLYECDVCSSLLTDAKGTVTSANYPSPYPNNAKCVWVIQAPSDLVTLTFAAFNLQSAPNCASDYIRVYDGRTRTSPLLLDRTCGSKRVPALIASSSMMLVEFVGSKNLKATGFSASYSTVKCGGTYYTPSRNITSPGYPKNYPPNSNCSYIITAPASHKVSLSKISFYTQNSHTCSNDYLSVYDGTSTNAPLLKTFCGPLFTLSATSTGQNMFLRFISDQTEQAPGFVLTYSFVPIS